MEIVEEGSRPGDYRHDEARTHTDRGVMSDPSDAQIMAASVEDPSVFAQIYDRHAETTLRFLVRCVGLDVAEGLMGETFRIAFEGRGTFDQPSPNARPWLYGIASNLLLEHRRSEARPLRANARLAAEREDGQSSETTADTHRLLARIVHTIDALPEGERDALLLFAWEARWNHRSRGDGARRCADHARAAFDPRRQPEPWRQHHDQCVRGRRRSALRYGPLGRRRDRARAGGSAMGRATLPGKRSGRPSVALFTTYSVRRSERQTN
jgi:DNA-directed RNA polymerase specialized sigma24 family protein